VDRFNDNVDKHGSAVIAVVQPIYGLLSTLVDSVGGVNGDVMGGYGDHEESKLVEDLWACSRGRIDMGTFLARHGFHGPREGELSAVVWREDTSPLERILEGYRALDDDSSPRRAQQERAAQRVKAERELLASLPVRKRAQARAVLRLARRYVPLRGVGKVAFLQSLDLTRAAARRLGLLLAEKGVLDDPNDIFFLTVNEVRSGDWDRYTDQVPGRRERQRLYQKLDIPGEWSGMPTAMPLDEEDVAQSLIVHGIGASAGVIEGRVRVISDPGEASMEPGEILVAHTTDPSWASVLFLSSALVVDVGGVLSHAAVIARELGVPCIVNTKVGTKVLRSGDLCRVDGSTGRVEVLERP
jgi:pyruvate,water dikinase